MLVPEALQVSAGPEVKSQAAALQEDLMVPASDSKKHKKDKKEKKDKNMKKEKKAKDKHKQNDESSM